MEIDPGKLAFSVAHVGVNCDSAGQALALARLFEAAFAFPVKEGASSCFVGSGVEAMKRPYLGANGHIAVATDDIVLAVEYLAERGFECDPDTAKYRDGRLAAIYLRREFGGFAVHLLQRH